jgi:hypothetical protein
MHLFRFPIYFLPLKPIVDFNIQIYEHFDMHRSRIAEEKIPQIAESSVPFGKIIRMTVNERKTLKM